MKETDIDWRKALEDWPEDEGPRTYRYDVATPDGWWNTEVTWSRAEVERKAGR